MRVWGGGGEVGGCQGEGFFAQPTFPLCHDLVHSAPCHGSDRIIDLQTTLALVLVAVLGFAGPSVVKKLREKRKS